MKKDKVIKNNKRSIFHLHRQLGLVVSLLVIVLAISGILLNHTGSLKLDSTYIESEILLKWYGITKPNINSYPTEKNWISHIENNLYLNDQLIERNIPQVMGAITTENYIAVASQNELILFTPNGEKIERLDAATGIPKNITSVGLSETKKLYLKSNHSTFQANSDITEWKISNNKNIAWSKSSKLPTKIETLLNASYRGKGLSKERVILDIHSGRILGKFGTLIMDLSAVLLLLLSLTGTWMYVKRSLAMRRRNALLNAAAKGDTYSAADLRRGEEGIVLTVIGDESFRQRLAAMGVMAGTVISTPATSIFGDPRTYLVRGYQLSMRTTEAALILLQTDELLKQHAQEP